ncbi:hypothetical protein F5Y19DRAFT_473571 [Xylariaceae sp. FL1651]|nr:hypothetical protein F5Y19DRAFT_473571 [Xylariaceae sp. FL1651]
MDSRGIEPRTTPMLREYYTTKPQARLHLVCIRPDHFKKWERTPLMGLIVVVERLAKMDWIGGFKPLRAATKGGTLGNVARKSLQIPLKGSAMKSIKKREDASDPSEGFGYNVYNQKREDAADPAEGIGYNMYKKREEVSDPSEGFGYKVYKS